MLLRRLVIFHDAAIITVTITTIAPDVGILGRGWIEMATHSGAEDWRRPFSKSEMEAARRALRDEEGLLAEVLALVRKLARQLPFAEDVLAVYHCVRDPATSFRVRFTLLAALAYFVMPIDAVPDFMPVLGFTDDAAVIAAAIASVRGAILPEHREQARRTLDDAD